MFLSIYGLNIECIVASKELVLKPFLYFTKNNVSCAIKIIIKEDDIPYHTFPAIPASFSSPRNIVYTTSDIKIIDYFGGGVVIHDIHKNIYTLYSRDRNFLMESFYLLVLSLFGQYCDTNNMIRIHALGLSYKDTAFLMPIPPGGGKSTMAFNILKDKDIKLISDDEPIYANTGKFLPFPLRIGTLNKDMLHNIPEKYVYSIDRIEFGKKFFIDCSYWEDQIEHRYLKKSVLFFTQRVLNGQSSICPTPKYPVFKSLIRDAVVGIGLYQGIEFLFSHSSLEVFQKFKIAIKRLRLALQLTQSSQTFKLTLSNDIQENTKTLRQFIKNYPSK